jgi:hypothetical protein
MDYQIKNKEKMRKGLILIRLAVYKITQRKSIGNYQEIPDFFLVADFANSQ